MRRSRIATPLLRGIFYALLAAALIVPCRAEAAKKGRLRGKVIDLVTEKPVFEALVAIQGTTISVLTDEKGRFSFDLPEGKVSISIHKDEYFTTNYQDIVIEGGQITTYKCELVPGDPTQNMFFSIGGITVLDKRELLPEQIETVHEITSAEIEHQLSTNLGDILDIVPGIERTKAPGLSEKTQIQIRGAGDVSDLQAALFGTKIMVDDITLSNNANLQSGVGTSYGATSTTAGSGLDLRTVPADNIESVEVITGVPSVEYGDLTTGLVKVKTKMGKQPHRLKIKSNPDTKEGNLNGGLVLKGTGISYTANMARSERNIRREGDEYTRYYGQLTFRNKLRDGNLEILNKLYYTGVHDEQNLDVSDPLSIETYNKDKTYLYGQTIDYKPTEDTKLEWRASLKYTKRDSYQQKLTGADTRILTDETDTGTYEGVFQTGAYIYKVWTKGEEYSADAKLNFRYDFGLLDLDHSLLAGGEYSFDDNVGDGKIFNPLYPPYGDTGYRPLSFDAVPALHTANIYLEDNISGSLRMRPWTLNLGVRYEMYTPFKLHLDGIFNNKGIVQSKNGTFTNPRVRFKYELFDDTQLRMAWGKSSKMPSMTAIFQGPEYIEIVEENVTPPDSVPLISTYVYEYNNRDLVGYQDEKTEISIDRKIGPVGLVLTGYYTHSEGMPREQDSPIMLYRYRWEDYPDPASASVIDTIYADPGNGYYKNVGWFKNYGVEFQFLTKRIEKISTAFRITGSYYQSKSGAAGTYMGSPKQSRSLGRTVYPYYFYTDRWRQKMIVNYKADWFIKKLGMWMTFDLQQTLFESNLTYDDPALHSPAYYDPLVGRVVSITPRQSTEYGLDPSFDEYYLRKHGTPNDRLLFNINVSKSLGSGAEMSLFVHNFFDDLAYYQDDRGYWNTRNHEIFYGIEFSMILDGLWARLTSNAEDMQ